MGQWIDVLTSAGLLCGMGGGVRVLARVACFLIGLFLPGLAFAGGWVPR